jgi:hypothetical protein
MLLTAAFQVTCANARLGEVFAPINYVRYATCPVITQLSQILTVDYYEDTSKCEFHPSNTQDLG